MLGDDGEGLLLSATSAHQAHAKGGDEAAIDTVHHAREGTSCKKEQANTALCMLTGRREAIPTQGFFYLLMETMVLFLLLQKPGLFYVVGKPGLLYLLLKEPDFFLLLENQGCFICCCKNKVAFSVVEKPGLLYLQLQKPI